MEKKEEHKLYDKAITFYKNKQYEECLAMCHELGEEAAENIPGYYYLRGVCYNNTKKIVEAIQDFNTVLEQDPEHIEAAIGLGEIYYAGKMFPKAVKEFSRVIYYHPQNYLAIHWRLLARLQIRDAEGALINHAAAQADADSLLPAADEFFNLSKDGKKLPITSIDIGPDGKLNFKVKQ